jgi:hypothetical protein
MVNEEHPSLRFDGREARWDGGIHALLLVLTPGVPPQESSDRERRDDLAKTRLIVWGSIPTIVADVIVTALGHAEAAYPISGVWAATCAVLGGRAVVAKVREKR